MQKLLSKALSWVRRPALLVGALLIASTPAPLAAADDAALPLGDEVRQLVAELDRPQFTTRQRAAARLAELAADSAQQVDLAARLRQVLLSPATSFEVRATLAPIVAKLPAVSVPPPVGIPSDLEIAQLMGELACDSFAARAAANARLDWWLTNPRSAGPLLGAFRQRLAALDVPDAARRPAIPAWRRVRAAWLLSDPSVDDLPPVDEVQLAAWVEELVAPAGPPEIAKRRRLAAWRELLDALSRDQYTARVSHLLSERLTQPLDEAAIVRVRKLLAWTRPALAAEYWSGGQHGSIQHLLVGVPQYPEFAQRASFFDRCDERVAHCVSGNSLSPGDHRVGVAIVHPSSMTAMFHLVNLPSPRRRLAYREWVKRPEPERLRAISERSVADILATRRELDEENVVLLAQLDAEIVSRFAGQYFALLPDAPFAEIRPGLTGQVTRNRAICHVLAERGTPAALESLATAAEKGQLSPASAAMPLDMAWIAALAIAGRYDTPEVDAFLAAHLAIAAPLVVQAETAPTIGASAAAILVTRHGGSTESLGLRPAEFSADTEAGQWSYGVRGFTYASPEGAEMVRAWWLSRRSTLQQADGTRDNRREREAQVAADRAGGRIGPPVRAARSK